MSRIIGLHLNRDVLDHRLSREVGEGLKQRRSDSFMIGKSVDIRLDLGIHGR